MLILDAVAYAIGSVELGYLPSQHQTLAGIETMLALSLLVGGLLQLLVSASLLLGGRAV